MTRQEAKAHPPDRSHLLTEQRNPRSARLHEMSAAGIVRLIREEDRAVLGAMERAEGAMAELIERIVPRWEKGGRIVYIGAGTSGRLGVLDASEAPPTFHVEPGRVVGIIAGGDAALRKSVEGLEDDPAGAAGELDGLGLSAGDTVIGIASGGTTPYVLGALEHAAETAPSCLRALIVCTPIDRPAFVDHLLVLETGPEVLTGSTRMKAGTATKLALNTISTAVMVLSGRVYENLMVDIRVANRKMHDRAARIVAELTGVGRAEAFDMLERAGGSVKTAVVMRKRGVGRGEAEKLLSASGGRLHEALGEGE